MDEKSKRSIRWGKRVMAGGMSLLAFALPAGAVSSGETPTITATPPTMQAGDVSGDGVLSTTDAALILQYVAELSDDQGMDVTLADINMDGRVSTADAALALQGAVELYDAPTYDVLEKPDTVLLPIRTSEDTPRICREPLAALQEEHPEIAEAIAPFDEAFFADHALLLIPSSTVCHTGELKLHRLLQNGADFRVLVTYTEIAHYWKAPWHDCLLLVPVDKPTDTASVLVDYLMVTDVSKGNTPASFLMVSDAHTVDYTGFKAEVHTITDSVALHELVAPLCSSEARTAEFKTFARVHDDAFFRDHAILAIPATNYEHYELAGFRTNEDGTRTLLIRNVVESTDSDNLTGFIPFPHLFTVDVPRVELQEHPVTGVEIVEAT